MTDNQTSAVDGMPLHVVLLTAPAPMGGLETVVANLAAGLSDAGVHVTLIQLITPGGSTSSALSAVQSARLTHVTLVHAARAYRQIRDDVLALLPAHATTVLHSHGKRADLIGALVARSARLPHVSTVHGFITNTAKQRVARRVHEFVLRRVDRVIAVSRLLETELRQAIGSSRVALIPNAPPRIVRKARDAARALLGASALGEPSVLVGWVGRISREKGLDVFIQSLPLLLDRNAGIVVIGDGAERASLMAEAQAAGVSDRIAWLGAVPDAAALFSGLDVLVVSSRTEGTPMNVLEAIDAAVPVVATAVGGIPDLIDDGAGWLVPSESPSALAAALDAALGDLSAARARADQALARVRSRGTDWIAAHHSLYRQLSRS